MITMALSAFIDGVGVLGPGLNGWSATKPILIGTKIYTESPVTIPIHPGLPRAESRRVGTLIKIALAVSQEAVMAGQADAKQLACVFASSGGDGESCDFICRTLAFVDRQLSPTRFHNSVHNASTGYWGIAVNAMTPATTLCAYDGSFSAGLLEAMTQVVVTQTGILLSTYEVPYPEPLHSKRTYSAVFGLALVLMPQRTAWSLAQIKVNLTSTPATVLAIPELESLRTNIPSARGLPLLQALASGGGSVILDYLAPLQLAIELTPCN